MKIFQYFVLALMLLVGPAPLGAETIKRTSGGICHPSASSYHGRIRAFHGFDSLEACLVSGGRLPARLARERATLSHQADFESYDRSVYGHGWDDADGDC